MKLLFIIMSIHCDTILQNLLLGHSLKYLIFLIYRQHVDVMKEISTTFTKTPLPLHKQIVVVNRRRMSVETRSNVPLFHYL